MIAATASLTAPAGARFAARLPAVQLRLCLAAFVLASAPLVALKGVIMQGRPPADATDPVELLPTGSMVAVVGAGAIAGFASGLLGIGGGVVLTPALALATDMPQQTVLGTSLAAMVLPSMAGAWVHHRAGTIHVLAAVPLALGASVGAWKGGSLAVGLPEEQLRHVFGCVMGLVGAYMMRGALRSLRC